MFPYVLFMLRRSTAGTTLWRIYCREGGQLWAAASSSSGQYNVLQDAGSECLASPVAWFD